MFQKGNKIQPIRDSKEEDRRRRNLNSGRRLFTLLKDLRQRPDLARELKIFLENTPTDSFEYPFQTRFLRSKTLDCSTKLKQIESKNKR